MRSPRILLALVCYAALLATTAWASPAYPGSGRVLLAFSLSFGILAGVAMWPRLSIGYLFFAAFLVLGFWLKLMAHLILGYELIEPTGAFEGSAEQWDRALVYAALGAAGAAAGKLAMTPALERLIPGGRLSELAGHGMPNWYPRYRCLLWMMYVVVLLLLCAANYHYAFYQTGVEPSLVLPAHLNVFPAWLINIGFALGLAVLVNWELAFRPERIALVAAGIVLQAVVISISALSRSVILFQSVPALVVLGIYMWNRRDRRKLVMIGSVVFLTIMLVAAAVTTIRFVTYPLPPSQDIRNSVTGVVERLTPLQALKSPDVDEPSKAAIRDGIRAEIVRQVGKLVIGRWVGLEGVLAISSSRETGYPLLVKAVREDPRLGNNSIYQGIAQADSYTRQSEPGQFTFLTLPGVVGVLTYSGSATIVFLGMLLVSVVLLAIERSTVVFTKNAFFGITGSVALANVLVQMNFPYLSLVFIAQLLFATGVISVVQRWPHVPFET